MFAWWCALLGTAVLLTWAHAISSWPHGQDVRHFKALELLKFVMTHDDNWRPVLDRKIRVTEDFGRPPYHEEGADDTPVSWALFAPGQTEIDVVPLVQTVLRHYWWLGSYVLYAEYAVNTSFMCTTFENVSLQMFLLLMLDHKFRHDVEGKDKAVKMELAKKSLLTKALFHDGWSTLALFMDKLAATLSHLKMMADVEYEFSDIRFTVRRGQNRALKLLQSKIDDTVGKYCVRSTRRQVYANLGILETPENKMLLDATELVPMEQNVVRDMFDLIIERMYEMYEQFNVNTMAMENWRHILNFKIPIDKHINPYIKIDKLVLEYEKPEIVYEYSEKKDENEAEAEEDAEEENFDDTSDTLVDE